MSKSNLGTAEKGAVLYRKNNFVQSLEDRADGLKDSQAGLNGWNV